MINVSNFLFDMELHTVSSKARYMSLYVFSVQIDPAGAASASAYFPDCSVSASASAFAESDTFISNFHEL